jgi:hypothetical protein
MKTQNVTQHPIIFLLTFNPIIAQAPIPSL